MQLIEGKRRGTGWHDEPDDQPRPGMLMMTVGSLAESPPLAGSMDDAEQALTSVATPRGLDDPSLYLNRELSWLDFNDRVLAEAFDHRNPLLERVKFLAICASNLDEFYAKRVGWLKRLLAIDPTVRTVDGRSIGEQAPLTIGHCAAMLEQMDELWALELEPALRAAGIHIRRFNDLDIATREELADSFVHSTLPVLTPLVVEPSQPTPFISGGSLSLMLPIRQHRSDVWRLARVKLPANRPRFVPAGEGCFVPMEDLVGAHLNRLFEGAATGEWHVARVIRSIELNEPSEASQDLIELIESTLERRRFADPVTLEVSAGMPEATIASLVSDLELAERNVVRVGTLVGKADLMELAELPLPALRYEPVRPAVPRAIEHVDITGGTAGERAETGGKIFERLRAADMLVHHPYESFDATATRFVAAAAADPSVLAIKQTLYRTSPDSPMLESLIDAAQRGKQVAVIVELTARLDEANNIEWARRLENAGVQVAYGEPNLKVHSKLTLVVREEQEDVRLYAHVGTGNYNSRTARVYTDLGLFTADRGICEDLVDVFAHLTGYSHQLSTRYLLVAPYTLRTELEHRVRREIACAGRGEPARLMFKMNGLEDRAFVELLYEASAAGVQVDLVVRGICRLRAGVPGLSEHIRVVSVIGPFLEHARVYWFGNGGAPEVFIGSADLMKRNLDDRIEVLAPILERRLARQLEHVLELQLADDRQGWRLNDATWSRDTVCDARGSQLTLQANAPFG